MTIETRFRDPGRRRRARSLACVLLLTPLGACDVEPDGDPSAYRILECTPPVVDEATGEILRFAEVYVLAHIDRRLADEPELAAQVGLDTVETCEEGRHFAAVAQAYDEAHPVPEDEAQEEPAAPVRPLPTADPSSSPETFPGASDDGPGYEVKIPDPISPIYDGDDANFVGGVVLITNPNPAVGCTASFIRRDVLLTAAHCVSPVPSRLTITEREQTLGNNVRVQVRLHPNWTGNSDKYDDTALVFIQDPLTIPGGVNFGHTWTLYRGPTVVGTKLNIYGYGAMRYQGWNGTGFDAFDRPQYLHMGQDGARITVRSHSGSGYFEAKAGKARTCVGDSGGPAVGDAPGSLGHIWGTVWGGQLDGTNKCPKKDTKMWWTKASTKTNWIAQQLGTCIFWGTYGTTGAYANCQPSVYIPL